MNIHINYILTMTTTYKLQLQRNIQWKVQSEVVSTEEEKRLDVQLVSSVPSSSLFHVFERPDKIAQDPLCSREAQAYQPASASAWQTIIHV